ncbi:MAG: hypothetical protein HC815_05670 [Richelia sp. RM1_1_1]|nr:hypothetical protein [Richelia sp. RM1_1_1]
MPCQREVVTSNYSDNAQFLIQEPDVVAGMFPQHGLTAMKYCDGGEENQHLFEIKDKVVFWL